MNDDILRWLLTGETGMSSMAMASCFADIGDRKSPPRDPADFNRCLLFLQSVPEARSHLDRLQSLSLAWARLVDRWDEIEACFLEEAGLGWSKGRNAPKTYALMKEILHD